MGRERAVWEPVPDGDWNRLNDQLERQADQVARVQRNRRKRITASLTLSAIDYSLYDTLLVDSTSGNITITLPPAVKVAGMPMLVKKLVAANTITLDADGSELIDGSATFAFTDINWAIEIEPGTDGQSPPTYGWIIR